MEANAYLVSKETYECQKRPTYVKRDLRVEKGSKCIPASGALVCLMERQKRPTKEPN